MAYTIRVFPTLAEAAQLAADADAEVGYPKPVWRLNGKCCGEWTSTSPRWTQSLFAILERTVDSVQEYGVLIEDEEPAAAVLAIGESRGAAWVPGDWDNEDGHRLRVSITDRLAAIA